MKKYTNLLSTTLASVMSLAVFVGTAHADLNITETATYKGTSQVANSDALKTNSTGKTLVKDKRTGELNFAPIDKAQVIETTAVESSAVTSTDVEIEVEDTQEADVILEDQAAAEQDSEAGVCLEAGEEVECVVE